MKNTKEIRKSIVVLVVICLLTSAALAVVNHFTAPVSKANAEARAEQARLDAVPDDSSGGGRQRLHRAGCVRKPHELSVYR